MKHLALVLCAVLVITIAGVSVNAQSAGVVSPAAQPPEAVIKEFYKWYIRSIDKNIDPFKKGRATLKKYVTLRLIQEIEKSDLDADYFLQTQDWVSEWGDSVSVSKPDVRGTTATTIVTFDAGGLAYPRLKVNLRREGGVWKIDKVREARAKST